jgi:hypothetical protein
MMLATLSPAVTSLTKMALIPLAIAMFNAAIPAHSATMARIVAARAHGQ